MTISLRADSGGTAGAVQVNGTDALLLNSNGSMNTPAVTSAAKRLRISTTGTDATVSISADELVVSNGSGVYKVLTSVSLSPSTAVSGANGVDSGAAALNTWYAVWVIWNGATAAGLLSTSSTSPTLPSGYTFKARVGWIRTDGSAQKYPFSMMQVGRHARWVLVNSGNTLAYPTLTYGVQGNIVTPTFVTASIAHCVPTTAVKVSAVAWTAPGISSTQLVATSPLHYGYGTGTVSPELVATGNGSASGSGFYAFAELTLQSYNLFVAANSANCGAFIIGWEDDL